jgi:uncharacterized OB-fold protein
LEKNQESFTVGSVGEVFSFTIVYTGFGKMENLAPYVLAQIQFASIPDPVLGILETDYSQEALKAFHLNPKEFPKIQIGSPVQISRIDSELGPVFKPYVT